MDYLIINNRKIPTLLAITAEEQEKGLMHQPWPPPIMSFVYSSPRINKYWMSNTPSPLDIVFIHNNKITQIKEGKPYSTEIIGDNSFSDLVVEFPKGTCQEWGLKVGDAIKLDLSYQGILKLTSRR